MRVWKVARFSEKVAKLATLARSSSGGDGRVCSPRSWVSKVAKKLVGRGPSIDSGSPTMRRLLRRQYYIQPTPSPFYSVWFACLPFWSLDHCLEILAVWRTSSNLFVYNPGLCSMSVFLSIISMGQQRFFVSMWFSQIQRGWNVKINVWITCTHSFFVDPASNFCF